MTEAEEVRAIIRKMQEKYPDGIPEDKLIENICVKVQVNGKEAKKLIENLKMEGDIYAPRLGIIQKM